MIKTPDENSVLLILQMLQLHYNDDYHETINEFFNKLNEKRFLPEEYWLISHGLMDSNGKFSSPKYIFKTHGKEFSNWFFKVIDIMFPEFEEQGEGSSDKK